MVVVMLTVACTPTAAPLPAPRPATADLTPPTASVSPDESAWTKVERAAKQEGKLTIYSFNFIGDIGAVLSQSFQQKYGIRMDIITGSGAQIGERIKTEQRMGQVEADVMDTNAIQVSNVKKSGGTVETREIPALQEKNAWLMDPILDSVGHTIGYTVSYFTPFVNTNRVKEGEDPKSLEELTQPKWKGKIVMTDPAVDSSTYTYFIPLLRRKMTDLETVRAVGMNDVKFVINHPEVVRVLSGGEYAINVSNSVSVYAPALVGGAPIRAVALAGSTQSRGLAMAAIKGGPHPNAAKLFINWILSKDGQSIAIKALGVTSVRKDVPDFTPNQARIQPAQIFVPTEEEIEESSRLFLDKYLAKLWGR